MTSTKTLIASATVLFAASIGLQARQAPATPPAAAQRPPAGTAPGARGAQPGRGGGRGNPMAAKFTEACATCHGSSTAKGPVGPSLFDEEWAHGADDESIAKSIRDGYPEKGMPPFKDSMTDQETWHMVAY